MKMDYSLCRRGAKIVGYIDQAAFYFGGCFIVCLLIFTFGISIGIVRANTDLPRDTVYAWLLILWSPVVLLSVVIGLCYAAATMLLNATKVNTEPTPALHRAKFWRNWNFFVFICLCVLFYIFNRGFGWFAALIILRAVMLVVVSTYIEMFCKFTSKASNFEIC